MTVCVYKQKKITKICRGDLKDRITLRQRSITPPSFGEIEASITFTTLLQPWALVETVGDTRRFADVSIEDRPTHEVFINYDPAIWPLDSDNVFVELDDDRLLRIVGVQLLNEEKETIYIACTERGVDTSDASHA